MCRRRNRDYASAMSDKGDVAPSEEGGGQQEPTRPLWRRVLFGVQAARRDERTTRRAETSTPTRDRLGTVVVPIFIAILAFSGGALGSCVTSVDNERAIRAERDRIIEQFRLDQRKERYDEIRQQLTRLENASDFSKTAVLAGVNLQFATSGLTSALPRASGGQGGFALDSAESEPQALGDLLRQSFTPDLSDVIRPRSVAGLGAVKSTWQDAYTGLDQAISNAEIASSEEVINIARALRDKYRADYFEAILANIDVIIATYPDPKPDKLKLADALVGVPAETGPRSYDAGLLTKSTDDLTAMYVQAAKDDLELDDR